MSKRRHHGGPSFNRGSSEDDAINRKSLTQFEDIPYWEKLRKNETDYEHKMKDFASTKDLQQKRPPRKPIEPELFNQIMDTINKRKSQIEEYKRENPGPQVEIPKEFAKIKEVPTDYQKRREDYNMFVDNYVERQKSKYRQAMLAEQLVENLGRYEEVLKTGIYDYQEVDELEGLQPEIVLIPAKPKTPPTPQPPPPPPKPKPESKPREKARPKQKVLGPTLTLSIPEGASNQTSRRGTQIDLLRKDGTSKSSQNMKRKHIPNYHVSLEKTSSVSDSITRGRRLSGNDFQLEQTISSGSSMTTITNSLTTYGIIKDENYIAYEDENFTDNLMAFYSGTPNKSHNMSTKIFKNKTPLIKTLRNKKKMNSSDSESITLSDTLTLKKSSRQVSSDCKSFTHSTDGQSSHSFSSTNIFSVCNSTIVENESPKVTSKLDIKTMMNSRVCSDLGISNVLCKNKSENMETTSEKYAKKNKATFVTPIVSIPGKEIEYSDEEIPPVCEKENESRTNLWQIRNRFKQKQPKIRKRPVKSIDHHKCLTVLQIC